MLNLANGLGPEFDDAIRARFPTVRLTSIDQAQPWNIPAGTEVAFIRPGPGWTNAPLEQPAVWNDINWVQAISAGIDFYPNWVLQTRTLTRGRGLTAEPIAEYALCAMLNHEKNFSDIRVRRPEDWTEPVMGSLRGRVLGIVGFGALGQAIARLASGFGMHIHVIKRSARNAHSGIRLVPDLSSLVAHADHLVLAVPLTDETRGMIDADILGRAKHGLHVVNIARGALIDMDALVQALETGRVSRATLDVTTIEPPPADDVTYRHPRIFLTPHCSWRGGADLVEREIEQMLDNLERYISGRPLENLVVAARGY